MKTYLLLITILFAISIASAAQNSSSNKPETVQGAVSGFFDGLATLDTQKIKQSCTPGIKILESGKVWTIDSLILRVNARKTKSASFKRINHFDFLETTIDGNIAWTSYFNQATITLNEKTTIVKWLESAILRKEENTWKIVLLHSTELERIN